MMTCGESLDEGEVQLNTEDILNIPDHDDYSWCPTHDYIDTAARGLICCDFRRSFKDSLDMRTKLPRDISLSGAFLAFYLACDPKKLHS